MSNRKDQSAWFKIRLLGALLILITLPANKVVAQFKSNLYLNSFREDLMVRKDTHSPEKSTGLLLRVNYWKEIFQLPFPRSWDGNEDVPTILSVKKFKLTPKLYYDEQGDNFDFNLKGQVKLNSRISVHMAVFIFHIPRPRFLGASKSSSVSPYRLQGTLQLQKDK